MRAVAENQAIEDLGGGQFRLESGGDHAYYLRNGLWLARDFSVPDADKPAGLTHFFSRWKWALGVDAVNGAFRVYPDPADTAKYIEIASPTPLAVAVAASAGEVVISRYVTAQDTTYKFTFNSNGFKTAITCGTRAKAPNPINFTFTLAGLTRTGRKVYDAATAEFVCHLPDPWGKDNAGNIFGVTETINGTTLTLSVTNPAGLAFPILIDPSISPNPASSGYVYNADAVFANARALNTAASALADLIAAETFLTGGQYYIVRQWLKFDTSAIPDDAIITAARLYLYPSAVSGTGEVVNITVTDLTSAPTTAAGQFNQSHWGGATPANGGLAGATFPANPSLSAYSSCEVDPAVISISKTGSTYMGLRGNKDFSNVAPSGLNRQYYFVSGVGKTPYLEVAYNEAGGGISRGRIVNQGGIGSIGRAGSVNAGGM